jgi:hypothetical protein
VPNLCLENAFYKDAIVEGILAEVHQTGIVAQEIHDRLVVDLDEGDLNDDLTVSCPQLPDLGKNKTKTPWHL